MKWTNSATDPAGPIQVKRFNETWGKFSWEQNTYVELTGVVGVSESSSTLTSIGGRRDRSDVAPAKERIGTRYGWVVSRSNVNEAIAAMQAELVTLKANRPVEDNRRTPEVERERNEEYQRIDREQKERSEKQHATFVSLYGDGATVAIPAGHMAITATIHYNNSDAMTDYYDGHATLSPKFALMVVPKQAETERLARSAAEHYEVLRSTPFEWKTEKWSMGHGNYLTGPGFELPEEIKGLRKHYGSGGGEVTHGFWEIEFEHAYRDDRVVLPSFKGFGVGMPSAETTGSAAAEVGSVEGVTVRENTEKQGIEIRFPEKPDNSILETLKANGWRWSRFSECWYKRASDEAREFAHRFTTVAV